MSKTTDERITPHDFFGPLDAEFQFDLDAAATFENTKVGSWLGPESPLGIEDALAPNVWWGDYGKRVWLNPPYSDINPWLNRAVLSADMFPEFFCVTLLPSSTSTKWWHRWIWDADMHRVHPWVYQIRFPDKRLVFGPHDTGAKWPSVVAIIGSPHASR